MTCVMVELRDGVDEQDYLDSIEQVEARKVVVSGLADDIQKEENALVFLLIGAASVILLLGIIAVSVQINTMIAHQFQEIGYLKALGMTKKDIQRIFYFEAAIVVVSAGILGSVLGPALCKWFRIADPIAQGTAIGTAAHVIGTSKANEMGAVQGAVGSFSLVSAGLLTAFLLPVMYSWLL